MVKTCDPSLRCVDTILECDRRMDGRTDASTMAKTHEALHAVERKNGALPRMNERANRLSATDQLFARPPCSRRMLC